MSNYDAVNLAELSEENERLDQEGGAGGDFLTNFVRMPEKEGFVTLRLLPPGKGKKLFCATRTHRINNKSIHCPRVLTTNKMGNKSWQDSDPKNPCIICKYYNELWKDSEKLTGKAAEDLQNQARKIKPVERYYYNCIVRSEVDPKTGETHKNVGPKILSIGKTLHQRIVRAYTGDKSTDTPPIGDVSDFKSGRDLKIIKKMRGSGKDAYPNYDESKFLDPAPTGEKDQIEQWLSNLHDLASLRVLRTSEEMKTELKKHLGLIKEEDTGFDLSEFQKPATASVEQQVQAVINKPQTTVQSKPVAVDESEDAVLAEADFIAELKSMNS